MQHVHKHERVHPRQTGADPEARIALVACPHHQRATPAHGRSSTCLHPLAVTSVTWQALWWSLCCRLPSRRVLTRPACGPGERQRGRPARDVDGQTDGRREGGGGGEERMTTWPWPLSSPTQLRHCMVSQHCRWSQRTHSHTTIQCTTAHAFVRGDGRPPLNQWPAELFLPLDASP